MIERPKFDCLLVSLLYKQDGVLKEPTLPEYKRVLGLFSTNEDGVLVNDSPVLFPRKKSSWWSRSDGPVITHIGLHLWNTGFTLVTAELTAPVPWIATAQFDPGHITMNQSAEAA